MGKEQARQRILLVGDYNRSDFLHVAKLLHAEADFFFIEHVNKTYIRNDECFKWGTVLYWKDYNNAYGLLKKIKPQKVIFYFIESYNHVALNVACKVHRIPTYHLEHGLRFSVSFYRDVHESRKGQEKKPVKQKAGFNIKQAFDKYRNRRFFQNTIVESPVAEGRFLQQYYAIRSTHNIYDTTKKVKNPLRWPDVFLSFSPVIFKFHKELEDLPDGYPVRYTGIPVFDHFFSWKNLTKSGSNVLFIDQPLYEQNLFGWTSAYRAQFLKSLAQTIVATGKKLYIKPHPLNDIQSYSALNPFNGIEYVTDDWAAVVPDIDTVIGFSSTLLLPFMAMQHIGCLTMEVHPQHGAVPYSYFLLDSGVCHAVASFEELKAKLEKRGEWYSRQRDFKENFIENWMYKFDGKSSERLRSILMADEVA